MRILPKTMRSVTDSLARRTGMLSFEDCLGLCGLSEDEVAAISEHEHIPDIVAAELGCDLLKTPRGIYRLHRMMLDNLEHVEASGDRDRIRTMRRTCTQFFAAHPMPRVLS
jgi:hypothetical protein